MIEFDAMNLTYIITLISLVIWKVECAQQSTQRNRCKNHLVRTFVRELYAGQKEKRFCDIGFYEDEDNKNCLRCTVCDTRNRFCKRNIADFCYLDFPSQSAVFPYCKYGKGTTAECPDLESSRLKVKCTDGRHLYSVCNVTCADGWTMGAGISYQILTCNKENKTRQNFDWDSTPPECRPIITTTMLPSTSLVEQSTTQRYTSQSSITTTTSTRITTTTVKKNIYASENKELHADRIKNTIWIVLAVSFFFVVLILSRLVYWIVMKCARKNEEYSLPEERPKEIIVEYSEDNNTTNTTAVKMPIVPLDATSQTGTCGILDKAQYDYDRLSHVMKLLPWVQLECKTGIVEVFKKLGAETGAERRGRFVQCMSSGNDELQEWRILATVFMELSPQEISNIEQYTHKQPASESITRKLGANIKLDRKLADLICYLVSRKMTEAVKIFRQFTDNCELCQGTIENGTRIG